MDTLFIPDSITVQTVASPSLYQQLDPQVVSAVARELKHSLKDSIDVMRIATAIAGACKLWADPAYERRNAVLKEISRSEGIGLEVLNWSLDALFKPFTSSALRALAEKAPRSPYLFGFVTSGNIVGAGIHEIAQIFLAGGAVIVKTASTEPFFFPHFARTIQELDPAVGGRVAVFNWSREEESLTKALGSASDALIVFGEDTTVKAFQNFPQLIPFGSRTSGGLIALDEPFRCPYSDLAAVADALAKDVVLFEQRGCLSPHHFFVLANKVEAAVDFAALLAQSLDRLRTTLPPPSRLDFNQAAAVRSAREEARWRHIGGEKVELWEGKDFSYTVIFDSDASFRISPLCRTVYVSFIPDLSCLGERLTPVRGKLEAFALSISDAYVNEVKSVLNAFGVSYISSPGMMQSPPPDWQHGGGRLLRFLGYPV